MSKKLKMVEMLFPRASMALNTLKCNHLTPLGLKGLKEIQEHHRCFTSSFSNTSWLSFWLALLDVIRQCWQHIFSVGEQIILITSAHRGGATVLKVGGQILRAKQAEKFFDPPLFGQWGETKYCLDS